MVYIWEKLFCIGRRKYEYCSEERVGFVAKDNRGIWSLLIICEMIWVILEDWGLIVIIIFFFSSCKVIRKVLLIFLFILFLKIMSFFGEGLKVLVCKWKKDNLFFSLLYNLYVSLFLVI